MAFDLSKYKKSNINTIVEFQKKVEREVDERFWKLKTEKNVGSAIIRFLPAHPDEEIPFITRYSHFIKNNVDGVDRYYVEMSLDTIGQEDAVKKYWLSLITDKTVSREAAKEQAKPFNRKQTYISNILVISDKANPENNGKVFLYEYGVSIFKKIMSKVEPEDDDEPVDIFNFYEGCDFKLKSTLKANYANYDTSEFTSPKAIGTDEYIESIIEQLHPLQPFVSPSNFKSKAELEQKFNWVMDFNSTKDSFDLDDDSEDEVEEYVQPVKQSVLKNRKKTETTPVVKASVLDEDEEVTDDVLKSYFSDDEDDNIPY